MKAEFQCPKCQSEQTVKNGSVRGKPKRKCKSCCYSFTPNRSKGVDVMIKLKALTLYMSGVSIRRIAVLSGVSHPSVIAWIKKFGSWFGQRPEFPEGSALVLELDEMWHYVEKKFKNCGYGKSSVETTDILSIGSVVIGVRKPSKNLREESKRSG